MQHPKTTISSALLLVALALAGCGSGGSETKVVTPIHVASAAMPGTSIPVKYTCDGRDISPPLEWGTVPANTVSLVLFVLGLTPEPATKTDALSVEWAVAGLAPGLHRLAAGRLPPGAHIGTGIHGERYSICPEKGKRVQYDFELYGLSATEAVAANFPGLQVLEELNSGKGASANAHGSFSVSYERR
jgi:hypothetical protein